METVLLTGSTGFIGKNILSFLVKEGYHILAPVRKVPVNRDAVSSSNITYLKGNFYDKALLEQYKQFSPEFILHFAALRGEGKGDWNAYHQVNVLGTYKLIEFALNNSVKLFVYCSTVGVYGTIPVRIPAGPYTVTAPDGKYHLSKFNAEKLVGANLRHQIPFVIVRPTITYGYGDDGFLFKLVNMVHNRHFPLIRKNIRIHLLDVSTFGEFITHALATKINTECIVNLADKHPIYLNDLIDKIYSFFHGTKYPRLLRTPPLLHKLGEKLIKISNLKAMHTSLKLISHSWYYETSNLEQIFSISLPHTLERVEHYLKSFYSEKTIAKESE